MASGLRGSEVTASRDLGVGLSGFGACSSVVSFGALGLAFCGLGSVKRQRA